MAYTLELDLAAQADLDQVAMPSPQWLDLARDVDSLKRDPYRGAAALGRNLYTSDVPNPQTVQLSPVPVHHKLLFSINEKKKHVYLFRAEPVARTLNPAADSPAARYRAELLRRAPDFGIDRSEVEQLDSPVLVRVIDDVASTAPKSELIAAVRRYNEGLTQALSTRARAVAEAKVLSPGTIADLGELLATAGDASLRDVLRESPRPVLEILERDGVVTPQNRAAWVQGQGLSDEGKDRIEGMFLGRVVGTGERLSAAAAAVLSKLERAVPHLIRVAGLNPELSEIPRVQAALDVLSDAAAHGMTPEDLARQQSLFGAGKEHDPDTMRMAVLLDRLGPRAVGDRFKAWARLAAQDPRQSTMFAKPPTKEGAEEVLFSGMRTPNPSDVLQLAGDPRKLPQIAQALAAEFPAALPLRGAAYFWGAHGERADVAFKDGAIVSYKLNGAPKAADRETIARVYEQLRGGGREANPKKGEKLPPATPLVRSLAIAYAGKWKAEKKGDASETARLTRRVQDLAAGVRSESPRGIGQAMRLAQQRAKRAGIEVGR